MLLIMPLGTLQRCTSRIEIGGGVKSFMTCQYRGINRGDRKGRKLLVMREGRAGREYIICDCGS